MQCLAQTFRRRKYLHFQGCDLDLYRFVPTGHLDLRVRFPTGFPMGLLAGTYRSPGLVLCLKKEPLEKIKRSKESKPAKRPEKGGVKT